MDFRRFHSSSLVDSGGGGGTDKTPAKLPFLWRTIKSKLDSLGSSRRQAASQISSPGRDSDDSSPPDSPAGLPFPASHFTAALAAASDVSLRQRGSPISRFRSGLPSKPRSSKPQLPLAAPTVGSGSPAFGLAAAPSAPLTKLLAPLAEACASTPGGDRNDSSTTASSNATNVPSEARSGPLPTLSVRPQSPAGIRSSRSREDAPAAATEPCEQSREPSFVGRLLGMSPAIPAEMRRPVWSLEGFSVQKRLHKSNSSSVYRAVCRRSGITVALKVYFLSRVASNVLHMLKREIEIHSQLVHKHVARLYAAFMDEGERVVLVQEFAAQGDLYGVLQRLGGRMPAEQVADGVMRPFLEALSYMHSRGVCHRDIKPENILFSGSWRLLVADFGVSIDLNRERAVTRAGTEGYMAPEVERCPLKSQPHENKDNPRYAYSTAVDIWAVGVLAYELMVGFPPVVAMSTPAGPPPPPAPDAASDTLGGFVRCHMTAASLHFPASVPQVARSFVLAALSPDPLERPTAAQLLRHPWLQRLRQQQSGLAAAAGEGGATAFPRTAWEAQGPTPRMAQDDI